jgi:hypothetical protein
MEREQYGLAHASSNATGIGASVLVPREGDEGSQGMKSVIRGGATTFLA